jgi:hypothetical protein
MQVGWMEGWAMVDEGEVCEVCPFNLSEALNEADCEFIRGDHFFRSRFHLRLSGYVLALEVFQLFACAAPTGRPPGPGPRTALPGFLKLDGLLLALADGNRTRVSAVKER